MAANSLDVRVKLGIESKGLRDGLRKAQQETEEFKRKSKSAYKTAGKAAGDSFGSIIALAKKFAPAISAGAAAMAVVNKAMKENQTLTDAWARITESARSAYEGFVNSLVAGNFSGFLSNMDEIIAKAREAADAFDALETAQLFSDRDMARLSMEQEKHLSILRNKNITKEQRAESEAALKDVFAQMDEVSSRMSNYRFETFAKRFASNMANQGSNVDWQSIIHRNAQGDYELTQDSKYQTFFNTLADYEGAIARRDEMKKAIADKELEYIGKGYSKAVAKDYAQREFPEFAELNAAIQMSDEKIRELFSLLTGAYNDRAQYYRNVGRANRYLNKSVDGGGGGKIEDKPMEGSIAYLEQKRSEAQKQFNMAVDEEARKVARALIDSLTEQIEKLSAYNAPNLASSGISALSLRGDYQFTPLASIGKAEMIPIENFRFTQEELAEGMEILNDVFSHTTSIISGLNNKTLKANQVLGQIFNIIGGVLTKLGIGGKAAGTVISGFGTLIGSFATGGIIGGTSYRGDHLTAQVSSGEMILNRQQQRNLFNLLQGGGSAPSQNVMARVTGEELVITINNTLRRQGKATIG